MSLDPTIAMGEAGPIAAALDGWESRPSQVQMALAIRDTMARRGHLLVEAGTGLGKSFAYLVPAIERVVAQHERVVVVGPELHAGGLAEEVVALDGVLLHLGWVFGFLKRS